MDRKDLKIQALLEKISTLTTQKENEIADLRVELTVVSEEKRELESRFAELEGKDVSQEEVSEAPTDEAN